MDLDSINIDGLCPIRHDVNIGGVRDHHANGLALRPRDDLSGRALRDRIAAHIVQHLQKA